MEVLELRIQKLNLKIGLLALAGVAQFVGL